MCIPYKKNHQIDFGRTWSKPTISNPIPNPVVNVYLNIIEKGQLTFQVENQKFEYRSGNDLRFDQVLDTVIESKIVSRRVGIDFKLYKHWISLKQKKKLSNSVVLISINALEIGKRHFFLQ